MNNLFHNLFNMNAIDDSAFEDSYIHRYHPLCKIILTLFILVFILSSQDLLELIVYFIFVMIIGKLANIPFQRILQRGLIGLPFSLCIGLSNLILDHTLIHIFGITITYGLYSCILILLKTELCLSVSYILIATTPFTDLASALISIKVPSIFVLQLMMTYRYIFTFLEEAKTMYNAYTLRHPDSKGIEMKDMSSFAGHLLIKSMVQSKRVYDCMLCRGFNVKKTYSHTIPLKFEMIYPMGMIISLLVIIKEVL